MLRKLSACLFVPALILLLLAACQPVAEPTPSPTEVAEQAEQLVALVDTAWTVVSYGIDEEIPVLPDSYPSVNFMGERYNGYSGCNYFLGTYGVDGSTIGLKWPAITQGFCENELLLNQESVFLSALTAADEFQIDGKTLHLSARGTQVMTLEPLEPVPFEGTVWSFEFLQTPQAMWMPVLLGTSITAVFEGDTVSGSAGCNTYSGAVTRDGSSITIGPLAVTTMMCEEPEGIMEQEQRYLESLETAGAIRESARSFELYDMENLPLMLFHAD